MKREETIVWSKKQKADLFVELAVKQFVLDMQMALTLTQNGKVGCVLCAYERRRFDDEMLAWEEKNEAMIDQWMWWKGYVVWKTVPKGTRQYTCGPWPEDPWCEH